MASQQQILLMETIVAMKKAVKRKAYESDSDSSIEHNTNRGYKLQKRARFVRQGQLMPSTTPGSYKEVVEHAGFQRAIINRNPSLIDEEGYEIESDDDDERVKDALAAAAQANPFSSVRLEHILAPLTSVTDLPSHPTLSRPFTSKALTELAEQGLILMHKENAALWKVKPLLTKLHGDHIWAPCGIMTDINDGDLFSDETMAILHNSRAQGLALTSNGIAILNGENRRNNTSKEDVRVETGATEQENRNGNDTSRNDTASSKPEAAKLDQDQERGKGDTNGVPGSLDQGKDRSVAQTNGERSTTEATKEATLETHTASAAVDVEMSEAPNFDQGSRKSGPIYSLNNGSGALSYTSEVADSLLIHPLFVAPPSAQADRDQGLPEQEAEDVRRLLQLYVQKQEEVCRGTTKLFEGLSQADRYRKSVLKWAKAEAHCGDRRDMSDGEDWYDKEEWGLVDDLKKGQDEEEEDTTQTQKKTRNRR